MKWQSWIFDLDDTLLDTSGELIPLVAHRVCEFLVEKKIYSNLKETNEAWLDKKNQWAGQILIQKLVEEKIAPGVQRDQWIQEAYQIFRTPQIPNKLSLLPGAQEILTRVSQYIPLFLVTQGDIPTQMKKVKTLGISDYFRHIYYVDPLRGENKSQAFQSILLQFHFTPERVLSIGNRLDNEIELSNKLGMQTCYLPYGEHCMEVAQTNEQEPDYIIQDLAGLHTLMLALLKPSGTESL